MDGDWRSGAQVDNGGWGGEEWRQSASRVIQMPSDTDVT